MFYKLKVHPDSRQDKLVRKGPDAFELWVKAPAERGLANAAAIRLLAAEIKTEPKKIMLIKGARSPAKIVRIMP
ncbi:MAG: hypothetical protein A2270_00065 [Elusimicrobia bacterium RIFOXYA12_FULL_51_18]|nr:MAG: hypothetical protein A2270_00065 [Elusimicrobia bacterium RIFOXYA12_FULL_51_18]OGS32345.1 MAG: hypothetical protein A2218_03035 [Elusimicrobia bacterium RIFOXYA2_FULL_53_38]